MAVYDALGTLLHANHAFQTLWERLSAVSERDRSRDPAAILTHIGYPGPMPMGFHDTVSSAGTVASFALGRVAREEEQMARIGFPDLDHHRLVHQWMIGEVRRMQHRLMVSVSPRPSTPRLGEDRKYVPFLNPPADKDAS